MSSPLLSGDSTQIHRRKRSQLFLRSPNSQSFLTNLHKGRPENYAPSDQQVVQPVTPPPTSPPQLPSSPPCSSESVPVSQQMASLQTSSEPEPTPSLPSPPPCSSESVRVSQQIASPQTSFEPEPTPSLPSSPPCSSESVRVSQQIASPQTSSEPESTPSNAKTMRIADGVHIRMVDFSAEELRAMADRALQRLLLMNFGKLERKFRPFLQTAHY